MADEVLQPLNYIPEVILKKRKNNEEWAIRRKLQLEQKVRKLKSDSFVIKKPEQFIGEYRDKVPLTSNDIVEQTLSQHGIICLEDVVSEIANVGPHFKEVTSFLCSFALTKPEKALQGKKRRYNEGGDSGNREDHINELISKMN